MKKRKLILGLGIAAILVCGLGGFVLFNDPGTGELPESLAKLNPIPDEPTISIYGRQSNFVRSYKFTQSLEEVRSLLRQEFVKKRGWKDSNLYPPYNFQNPTDPSEIFLLCDMPEMVEMKTSVTTIFHYRNATVFETYKKKFAIATGLEEDE